MPNAQTPTGWTFLEHARIRAGYTRTSAALALGVSKGHYSGVENGLRGLGMAKTIEAADLFKVDRLELHLSRPVPLRGHLGQAA